MGTIKTYRDFLAPSFWQFWSDVYNRRYETYCCSGGRGSTKSTAISESIVATIERRRKEALLRKKAGDNNWKHYLTHAACFRKVGGTLADSCFTQFEWAIAKMGLSSKYIFRKTPLAIIRKGTNQRIYFRGLDDPMKARSLKAPFSWIESFWAEELSEFDNFEEIQDVVRSVQRGGHDFQTFFSYNPPETSSNWVNKAIVEQERVDPLFKHYRSDYRSVPREWLGDKFFRDANIKRIQNERAFRHIYLGEVTGNGGTILPNVKVQHFTDEEIARFDNIKWGADFGLFDPTTLIGCQYDAGASRLILFSEVYKSDMGLDDIVNAFKKAHFGYNYIYGDSAAAQLIVSLRQRGIPILPVEKAGEKILPVKWLQSLKEILVDDRRCPNTYNELITYEYEKNRAGEFTGRLPDGNDHGIDAMIYAITKTAKYDTSYLYRNI